MTVKRQQPKRGRPRKLAGASPSAAVIEKKIAYFWERVNKNGPIPVHCPELGNCWEWTGGGNGKGYGQVRINYRQVGTHQFAWELMHGEVPKGLWVLHKCDNRACVNPDHLFLGTKQDNTRDMIAKGRRGGNYKLTRVQIEDIRQRYAAGGITQRELAAEMQVTITAISLIVSGKTWAK